MPKTFAYTLSALYSVSALIGFVLLYLMLIINPMYMSESSNAPEYPNLLYEMRKHIDNHESGETVDIQDVLNTLMYVNHTVWNSILHPTD